MQTRRGRSLLPESPPPAAASLAWLVLVLAVSAAPSSSATLADHFKVCSRSDPQLGQCIVDSLNGAREQLVNGIPELGLAPLDPLAVGEWAFEEGQEELSLRVRTPSSQWTGLGNFTATRARVDFEKPSIEIDTYVPFLRVTAPYTFSGKVLTLPISGKGDFDNRVDNMNVTHRMALREVEIGGKKHWEVTRYDFEMDPGSLRVHFRDLFQGNSRLGIYANNFINRNWRPVFAVYKPVFTESFGKPLHNFTNAMLQKIPLDEIFTK